MVFVLVVAGMGVCMVQLHTSQSRRQETSVDRKRALYMAEAGLAEAFLSVVQGKTGNVGTPELPAVIGDGVYWVEATRLPTGLVSLLSTGLCGKGRFSITAVIQRESDPVASLGVYARTNVSVGYGSLIDGYSSKQGKFESQVGMNQSSPTTGSGGKVQSGENVTLEGRSHPSPATGAGGLVAQSGVGTTIFGDALPGPTGVLVMGSGVMVTGSTAPGESNGALPAIETPQIALSPAPDLGSGLPTIISPGAHAFSTVELKASEVLVLEGPLRVVFEQLVLNEGAVLRADNSAGVVTVFVSERLQFSSGSVVESITEVPADLVFMVSAHLWSDFDGDEIADNPVEFNPSGKFYGYLYAPESDLSLTSETHLIGGVAANSLALASGSRVTYDQALASTLIASSGLPLQVAWRTSPVPDEPICRSRRDPISYLEDQGVVPLASGSAHEEGFVKTIYVDNAGLVQEYMGPVSLVDWSDVNQVLSMMWDNDPVVDGDNGQEAHRPLVFNRNAAMSTQNFGF